MEVRKYILKLVFVVTGILFLGKSNAQDIHFTQFYAHSPSLNPALTGFINGVAGLGLQYKTQWYSFTTPYDTRAAFVEWKWKPKVLKKDNWFGQGLNFFADQAGEGHLKQLNAKFNFAFHKSLNSMRSTYLSVGFTGGIAQKSLNTSVLNFGNQWTGVEFDNTISNNEPFTANSHIYLDLGTGILFSSKINRNIDAFIGYGLFHANKHNDSFYDRAYNKSMKSVVHGGLIKVSQSRKFTIKPGFYYFHSNESDEFILGSNFVFSTTVCDFYLGAWYRFSGDISPVIGLDYKNLRLLMNYDYNLMGASIASNAKGGAEISLYYLFPDNSGPGSGFLNDKSKRKQVSCPTVY